MARRLISQPMRMRGGSTLGFGARMRVYDDEALTVLSTIYRRSTGAGAQPNPLLPNAGRVTALTVAGAAADVTITVANTAGFQVGDLIPIRSGATFTYKVITAINVGTGVITLDSALGAIYATATTIIGAPEMRGHVWGWLETVVDPFAEIEDIASGRRSPPIQIPLSLPAAAITFRDEGANLGQFSVVNAVGSALAATDAGAGVLNLTHDVLSAHAGTVTDAGHGTRGAIANAHALADITGLAAHAARHNAGGADVMAIDAVAATGSLRTLGTAATQAAAGNHTHVATLTSASADLAADVGLSAGSWSDGPSVSLVAGTWLVNAGVTISTSTHENQARITDGTTHYASGAASTGGSNRDSQIGIDAIITLASTTTIKVQGNTSNGGGATMRAATTGNGSGNNATHIRAVRIA